ncbi:hypothetical protein GCM10018790_63440 [Kitasatospora xanthocidica]|nr:hypothetical protein GCM10018790_63440 [Kitasatospora xanthocidica]
MSARRAAGRYTPPLAAGRSGGGEEVERAAGLAALPGVGDEGGVDPADIGQVLAPVPHRRLLRSGQRGTRAQGQAAGAL